MDIYSLTTFFFNFFNFISPLCFNTLLIVSSQSNLSFFSGTFSVSSPSSTSMVSSCFLFKFFTLFSKFSASSPVTTSVTLSFNTRYFFFFNFLSNFAPISSAVLCVPSCMDIYSLTTFFFNFFNFISPLCFNTLLIVSSQSNLSFFSGTFSVSSPSSTSMVSSCFLFKFFTLFSSSLSFFCFFLDLGFSEFSFSELSSSKLFCLSLDFLSFLDFLFDSTLVLLETVSSVSVRFFFFFFLLLLSQVSSFSTFSSTTVSIFTSSTFSSVAGGLRAWLKSSQVLSML